MLTIILATAAATGLTPVEAMDAYEACMEEKTSRYASTEEPAETVARAAEAACREQRTALRTIMQRQVAPDFRELAAETLDDFERDQRQQAVMRVLEERLGS